MQKFFVMLLILFGLPGVACSQQPEEPMGQAQQEQAFPEAVTEEPALLTAEGTLSKVDADQKLIWIKDAEGKEMQFSYNDETLVEGETDSVEGLSKMSASQVRIHYRSEAEAEAAPEAAEPEAAPGEAAEAEAEAEAETHTAVRIEVLPAQA